jgi:hypothetical protein
MIACTYRAGRWDGISVDARRFAGGRLIRPTHCQNGCRPTLGNVTTLESERRGTSAPFPSLSRHIWLTLDHGLGTTYISLVHPSWRDRHRDTRLILHLHLLLPHVLLSKALET